MCSFVEEMSASFSGRLYYRNVIGSTVSSRSAFDGSVPNSVSCGLNYTLTNSTSAEYTGVGRFCVIGVPGDYVIMNNFPAEAQSALTRQCVINLRDIWIEVKSNVSTSSPAIILSLSVSDPTAAAPSSSAEHTFLYQGVFYDGVLRIPDISGLVVSAGMNVEVNFTTVGYANSKTFIVFHSVADIDD